MVKVERTLIPPLSLAVEKPTTDTGITVFFLILSVGFIVGIIPQTSKTTP